MGGKKKKQTDLGLKGPGVEKQTVPEIDDAAEEYVQARDRRMALSKTEKECKTKLMALMKTNKLEMYSYETDGVSRNVEIVHKDETIKVKTVGEDDGDEDGELEVM